MTGITQAVQASSVTAPLDWPQKTGQLLGVLDEITVRAALAAEMHTDPEVLRERLREVATIADRATKTYQ
jgi:hypothetical protein